MIDPGIMIWRCKDLAGLAGLAWLNFPGPFRDLSYPPLTLQRECNQNPSPEVLHPEVTHYMAFFFIPSGNAGNAGNLGKCRNGAGAGAGVP